MGKRGAKFVGRNRAPRVQIEYETEEYGAEKAVRLPFIMGVMADLAGKPEKPLDPVARRKFVDIDAETFDKKMEAMKPRVAFPVTNVLTKDEGNLMVDMTFSKMDDFSPAAVARKVGGLDKLFEARTQLENLLTNLDGKDDAVKKLTEAINNPALLQALSSVKADPAPEAGGGETPADETPQEGEE